MIAVACFGLFLIVLALGTLAAIRAFRVHKLRLAATQPISRSAATRIPRQRSGDSSASDQKLGKPAHQQAAPSAGTAATEGAAAGILGIPAVAAWQLWRIDPSVVEAISAASSQAGGEPAVDASYHSFIDFVNGHADSLDVPGYTSRLVGYVGEQQVHDILVQQGHMVEMAASPNNPGWDLLVDGAMANVKTYQDAAGVVQHAQAHPDIDYLLPTDAAHQVTMDNVVYLDGFSHADASGALTSSLDAAQVDVVGAGMDVGIPVTLIAFTLIRETQRVRHGKKISHAVADGGANIVVRGAGMLVGAKIGGSLGLAVDAATGGTTLGLGSVVGVVGGSVAGSTAGAMAINWYQRRGVRAATGELTSALAAYGEQFTEQSVLDKIQGMIEAPYERSRRGFIDLESQCRRDRHGVRWWIWPSSDQVLRDEVLKVAEVDLADQASESAALLDLWNQMLEDPGGLPYIGLTMANAPQVAAELGASPIPLHAVERAFIHLEDERERLASRNG